MIEIDTRKKYLRNLLFINLSLIIASAIYVLIFVFVFKNGSVSLCFMKERLNMYCPGCGGSRSLMALLRLDFAESFILYPPLIIAVPVIFELDVRMIICAVSRSEKYMQYYSYKRFYIIALAIILNFFIRNILLYFFKIDFLGDIMR